MSLIEFQIGSAAFLRMQRNALRSLPLCPPAPVQVGPVRLVLDRLEFGDNALRHEVLRTFAVYYEDHGERVLVPDPARGLQLQLTQDVVAHVTTEADILAHPNGAPATIVPVAGTLVYDLDVYLLDDDAYLQAQLDHFEPGPLPAAFPLPAPADALVPWLRGQLGALLPSRSAPLGLAGLLPRGTRFLNAGLSVDTQLQRVEVRVQIGGSHPSLDVPWGNFFSGHLADRLQGSDWSLFVEAGFLTELVKAQVNAAITSAGVDHLDTYVSCGYTNADGRARLTLDVLGIYELPDPLPDPAAEPRVSIELTVPQYDTLVLDADLSQVIDLIDRLVDALGTLLPFLAGPLQSLVHDLIGSVLAGAADEAADAAPVDDCVVADGSHIRCTRRVGLSSLVGGANAQLRQVLALEDGVALAGSYAAPELTQAAVQTSIREFVYNPPRVHCGPGGMALIAAYMDRPRDRTVLHADGFAVSPGSAPVYLCGLTVLNDPLGAFPTAGLRTDSGQAPIHIAFDLPVPGDAYYAPGPAYPCDLLVKTTGGTRLLRFQPPPRLSQADIERLAALLLAKVASCEQLIDPWFRLRHGYSPNWSVDPAPGLRVDHLWTVEVAGLRPGDQAALVDGAGRELVRGVAREGRPLRMSALLAPGADPELTIARLAPDGPAAEGPDLAVLGGAGGLGTTLAAGGGAGGLGTTLAAGGAEEPPLGTTLVVGGNVEPPLEERLAPANARERLSMRAHGLAVGQLLLERLGTVPLPARGRGLRAAPALADRGLLVILPDAVVAYDLAVPRRPALLGFWRVPGVRGALSWGRTVLVYGDAGFGWIEARGGFRPASGCELSRVGDAALLGSRLLALQGDELHLYSDRLCTLGTVPLPGARSLAVSAGRIVAGGAAGLVLLEGDRLEPVAVWEESAVHAVRRAPGVPPGAVLALLEDGSARLLQVDSGTPAVGASYPRPPWFAGAARVGELLVTLTRDRAALLLRRPGASATL